MALFRQVRQEPLTVLYSKSGMGKSSLLNAGVIPTVEESGDYRTLRIRFNSFDKNTPSDKQLMPDSRLRENIRGTKEYIQTFLDKLIDKDTSIWHELKVQQVIAHQNTGLESGNQKKILLILDQFEELFTYPPESILEFRKQLAEVLYTPLPNRYWDLLELYGHDECPLDEMELNLLQKPLELSVIMAIRQDRMHLLGQLADYLPNINKGWYELKPLTIMQARQAIMAPAAFLGDFMSNSYRYDESALEEMLKFLTEEDEVPIESTQLQIVCSSIEKKVITDSLTIVKRNDVGDLENVIENYYLERISTIGNETEQTAARRLLEEALIYEEEERRLSLYEGIIVKVHGVSPKMLVNLVDSHLLRSEPSINGGYTYELSHDTLVSPVLKAKAKRVAEETSNKEKIAQVIRERELEEFRQKAISERKKRIISGLLSLLFLIVAIFAINFYLEADQAKRHALLEKQKAEQLLVEYQSEQKEKAIEQYRRHLVTGNNLRLEEDFEGALAEYEAALEAIEEYKHEIDNGGEQAKIRIRENIEISNKARQFNKLIEEGNKIFSKGPDFYRQAYLKFIEAESLNYRNTLANQKKQETFLQIEASFEEMKEKGSIFFNVKNYEAAFKYFSTACRLKPDDQYVKRKLAEVNAHLNK